MTKTPSTSTSDWQVLPFCCTQDVVGRQLPKTVRVRYPNERVRLLNLMAQDQADRMSPRFFSVELRDRRAMTRRDKRRAEAVTAILDNIKTPSVRNVGIDGSRAVWLIALHNYDHKNLGRLVLIKMRRLFYKDKSQVFYPGIPYLADRLAVARQHFSHTARQWYGTQGWYVQHENGTHESKLFPIAHAARLVNLRRKYLLSSGGERCEHSL